MKITRRQLKRFIREEKARTLDEQSGTDSFDPVKENRDAYDLLMDVVTDKLYPGPRGEPASRDKIYAWVSALNSVAQELQEEMPPRPESEFVTLRDPVMGESTRRRIRRNITEIVGKAGAVGAEREGVGYVANMLKGQAQGPGKGFTFGELAMNAIEVGDLRKAANKVMDALWVDDPWPEDEQALEDLLAQATAIEDVTAIGAEWLDGFRKGIYTSEEQKTASLNKWSSR